MAISWTTCRVSLATMKRLARHRRKLAERAENGEDVQFSVLHGIITVDTVITDLLDQIDGHRAAAARSRMKKADQKALAKLEN